MNVLNDSAREESKEVAHVETVLGLFSYLLENTFTTARRRYTSRGNLSLLNSLAKVPLCSQPEEILESPSGNGLTRAATNTCQSSEMLSQPKEPEIACGDVESVWGSGARQGTRYSAIILNMTLQLHHPVEGKLKLEVRENGF